MPIAAKKTGFQTTTIRLPKALYEEARLVVEGDKSSSRSLNELMVTALVEMLKQVRRNRIDDEFSAMRHDAAYERESQVLADEFKTSDRETLRPTRKARR